MMQYMTHPTPLFNPVEVLCFVIVMRMPFFDASLRHKKSQIGLETLLPEAAKNSSIQTFNNNVFKHCHFEWGNYIHPAEGEINVILLKRSQANQSGSPVCILNVTYKYCTVSIQYVVIQMHCLIGKCSYRSLPTFVQCNYMDPVYWIGVPVRGTQVMLINVCMDSVLRALDGH